METQTRPFQQNKVQLLALRNPPSFFQICLYPLLFAILALNLRDWFHIFSLAEILQFSESRLQEYLQLGHTCTQVTHPFSWSLNSIWLNSKTPLGPDLQHWTVLVQLLQGTLNPWPHKGHGSLMLWLPWDPDAHTTQSHHITQQSVPLGLSCTSYSQPFPFLWIPEVCTMYLQAFSSWKILTNRKFSHFPGWKPNLCIRNACPYFQFSPFSVIPPSLSGNAQLRLPGL